MANQSYILPVSNVLSSDFVADGNYDFETEAPALPVNLIDYFHFVDGAGNLVTATGGTVVITADSGNGVWQKLIDASFDASDANNSTRTKPSGRGRIEKLRVTLANIAGADGFRLMLTQSLN